MKGASTWLTVLPLTVHGFTLHKSAFHDALVLRYGWTPSRLPSKCECGNSFNVEHALSCAMGGFLSLRHNEIRDITASLLTEVCSEVCVEPDLQSVTPDQLYGASANSQDGARLDVSANGVWGGRFQKTFDIRVFNPLAPSNRNQAPAAVYRKHELEKKRAYQQRAYKRWNIPPSFPLFFQPQEVWVRSHHLLQAPGIAHPEMGLPYSTTLCWLQCCLSYLLLRSSIQAIRGARSSQGHAVRSPMAIDLAHIIDNE